jgi:hypothetical protein
VVGFSFDPRRLAAAGPGEDLFTSASRSCSWISFSISCGPDAVDVADEAQIRALVVDSAVRSEPIDLFCSNAANAERIRERAYTTTYPLWTPT